MNFSRETEEEPGLSLISLIDVMVKKGVLHENTGSRYKSRLTRRLAASAS